MRGCVCVCALTLPARVVAHPRYACPAGSTSPTASMCAAGQFSAAGAGLCTVCSAGKYCPPGSRLETSCPAGTYSLAGAAVCKACPAGTYNSYSSFSSCTVCPSAAPYSLSNSVSGESCTACPGGSSCSSSHGSFPCIDTTWTLWYNSQAVEAGHRCVASGAAARVRVLRKVAGELNPRGHHLPPSVRSLTICLCSWQWNRCRVTKIVCVCVCGGRVPAHVTHPPTLSAFVEHFSHRTPHSAASSISHQQ
jgi:hypothetical protein